MRFSVELELENELFPKDKNRVILSFLKRNFSNYDMDFYKRMYEDEVNKPKDYCFSLFMGRCEFLKDEIRIPDKKIILNFSSYNMEDGIYFYNSILENKKNPFKIKNNTMKISGIRMIKEKTIKEESIIVKTLSPIVARKHTGDNKKTWYYSLDEEEGKKQLDYNIKENLLRVFGDEVKYDFKDLKVNVLRNKIVKVKNYNIVIPSNIAVLEIKEKPYILDYLYKAGLGSKKSQGFGMIDII
ncbi:MAG: CRISPR-associated endoribonuclease Cas6 [Miniphocaeibacter sp.]|uniref:CRISPR-associated endoribonuclease Cas6 n=1 Tax=Miniphocaeibacter sp. TaxID=3100973 RepID=UPI0017B3F22C|nr:CRISPR-associated endoribonuclease Cas6 [Gallicola sp.]